MKPAYLVKIQFISLVKRSTHDAQFIFSRVPTCHPPLPLYANPQFKGSFGFRKDLSF